MRHRCMLDEILEPGALSVVCQPIFKIQRGAGRAYALECLIRGPKGTTMESPNILFEYVRKKGEESRVDRVCIATILREAGGLSGRLPLCINIHGSTLGRDDAFLAFFLEAARSQSIPPSRLVLEIIEQAPSWNTPHFLKTLDGLRAEGVQIALDDVGFAQSNYKMILDLRPDYFKIDRYFIKECHRDSHKRAIIESIQQLALKFGARVIAEGIEEIGDLEAVAGMGIDLIQGYLYCPPMTKSELEGGLFLQDSPNSILPAQVG